MDIPIVRREGTDYAQIEVTLEAYKRLVMWASVSRTLDNAERLAQDLIDMASHDDDEFAASTLDELEDIHSALDECHQAVRRHYGRLAYEQRQRQRQTSK